MGILDLFKPDHSAAEATEIAVEIERLSREKKPLHMELEELHTHFQTVLSLKGDVIMVAKPPGMADQILRGAHLRFIAPWSGKEIRFEVSTPNINLNSGGSACLCALPDHYSDSSRQSLRIETARFNNVLFKVQGRGQFRVLDLSESGFRFLVGAKAGLEMFPLGRPFPGILDAGRYHLPLERVIPRVYAKMTVGCEFELEEASLARKHLHQLIDYLELNEETRAANG
ncbi:MAG: hypothetical protein OEV94_10570 [Deltaproteobacteria bacterium]|nr:hypothetical protein [Deltaproteobacteria bacterium]